MVVVVMLDPELAFSSMLIDELAKTIDRSSTSATLIVRFSVTVLVPSVAVRVNE